MMSNTDFDHREGYRWFHARAQLVEQDLEAIRSAWPSLQRINDRAQVALHQRSTAAPIAGQLDRRIRRGRRHLSAGELTFRTTIRRHGFHDPR
ncbi:MAG: hypothetical protein U0231_08415 [Nitrospiraceae bacterium]